ncbi:unnamed protein product [Gongylonema pulchrum]|uniref:ELM2 domain-containing protein n=1 Tax=Gongylonema pulchrum TaxID=637853 RepID=A0A183DBU0_9BILA|nr:unnamed protein product [Gongylonema pulchrum]
MFKGTARYAPLAAHQQKAPGRRDDLESWMYQQVEFSKGSLPWKDIEDPDDLIGSKVDIVLLLAKITENTRTKEGMAELFRGCPRYYLELFKYIISMRQKSQPDYELFFKVRFRILPVTFHYS